MVLYLTYWVPAEERARTGALFMMAAPVAIIVGAPVSEAVLSLDGWMGLHGWQWLFLLEGLPAVVLGFVALRVLTDRPEQATWLPDDDREWLSRTMTRGARAARPGRARVDCAQPGQRTRLAAVPRVLPQHDRHLRHLPVAAEDPCRRRRA